MHFLLFYPRIGVDYTYVFACPSIASVIDHTYTYTRLIPVKNLE